MKKWIVSIAAVHLVFFAGAQQLDQIGSKDMVKVSGGLGYNMVGNFVDDQPQYRDPLSWVLSGNVNVSLLNFSLPFTFSFSNAGKSYTQPFNMTAIHPSYKWVKTHIGITSMSFSPYTYSGLNFAGGGVELSPKKWKIQAFGGRLKKAIEYNPSIDNLSTVSYRRMGYGLSAGYENKGTGATVILLKAQDDPQSLQFTTPNSELQPMDNLVTSVKGKTTFFKTLQLDAEYALSMLTQNVLINDNAERKSFYAPLVQGNSSTIAKSAYNASLGYRYKVFGISLKYERIDPGYLTLGGLFFNNDLENITIAPTFALFENKVTLMLNTGFQRNNLDERNATNLRRWVGNASLNAQLIKGMTLNLNYSNFSSFSRRNPAADPFYTVIGDTMNYYQTSQSVNASLTYAFGKKTKQVLNGNFSYNNSQNITGRLQDAAAFGFNVSGSSTPTDVYTGVFSHTMQLGAKGFTLGYMLNYNEAVAAGQRSTYYGPGLNGAQPLFKKKLNLTFGGTYNRQYLNDALANHVMNFRLGSNISPEWFDKKYGKVTCALNATYTQKFAVSSVSSLSPKNLAIIANIQYSF